MTQVCRPPVPPPIRQRDATTLGVDANDRQRFVADLNSGLCGDGRLRIRAPEVVGTEVILEEHNLTSEFGRELVCILRSQRHLRGRSRPATVVLRALH